MSLLDPRAAPGSKLPRHLSTFHPSGVSRTIRCNPALLRPHPGHSQSTSALAPSPGPLSPASASSSSASAAPSSFTDNGQPVKKVSFHEDVSHPRRDSAAASPYGGQRAGGAGGGGPHHHHGGVDRWQSPLLIGGVAGEAAPPPAPPPSSSASSSASSQYQSQYPSLNRHQYANVSQKPRIYSNVSPRLELDSSLDTMDDSASTTTSGSYQVDLESLPPPPCPSGPGGRHPLDQNSVV